MILFSSNPGYVHRFNEFTHYFDSICRICGKTIASCPQAAELIPFETDHFCMSPDLDADLIPNHGERADFLPPQATPDTLDTKESQRRYDRQMAALGYIAERERERIEHLRGYEARWNKLPIPINASEAWKAGWRAANTKVHGKKS